MTTAKSDTVKVGPFAIRPRIRDGAQTGAWFLDLPPHLAPSGKRERRSFPSKAAATAEAKRLLRELQLDGAIRAHGPKLSGVTFAEMSKRWLEEQVDRVTTGKKRASTLTTDGYKLKALLPRFGAMDGAKIGTKDVADHQKDRAMAGCAPATINGETSILLQILKWGLEKGFVERLPKVENIPLPLKRTDIPTPAEVARIFDALTPLTGLLVRFLAETGVRKGEAFALEWDDLDADNCLVMIRRKEGFTPKTRHSDRDIPVTPALMEALKDAKRIAAEKATKKGTDLPSWVFPGKEGKQRVDMRKALASAIVAAAVKRRGEPLKLTPHGLRKAMATWLHVRGVSDAILQPRLGHAPGSRITASTYVKVTTEDMPANLIDLDAERVRRVPSVATG